MIKEIKRKIRDSEEAKKNISSLIVIMILILSSFTVLFLFPNNKPASASWWDANWTYYKKVTLSNANNSCVIKINVTYSSGGNVTCNSHCNADFSDLRFIDVDNTTNMAYWIERSVLSSYAVCWVNTSNSIASDGALLLYYGNALATSQSSGNNTFSVFEDYSLYETPTVPQSKFTLYDSGAGRLLWNYVNDAHSFNVTARLGNKMRYVFKYNVNSITASATDTYGQIVVKHTQKTGDWTDPISKLYQNIETASVFGYNCTTNTSFAVDTVIYNGSVHNETPPTPHVPSYPVHYVQQPIYLEYDFGPNVGYYVRAKTQHYTNMTQIGVTMTNTTFAGFAFNPKRIIFGFQNAADGNRWGFNNIDNSMWFRARRGSSFLNYSIYWFFAGKLAYPDTGVSIVSSEHGGGGSSNTFDLNGLSSGFITFSGKPGNYSWCNATGIRHETAEIYMFINTTTNITEIRVKCRDLNDTGGHIIGAGNLSIQFSGNNISWGESGNTRSFNEGGSNISIDKATWTHANGCYGPNPFNGSGLKDKTASVYFRLRLYFDKTSYTTFRSLTFTSCKVYLGRYV